MYANEFASSVPIKKKIDYAYNSTRKIIMTTLNIKTTKEKPLETNNIILRSI